VTAGVVKISLALDFYGLQLCYLSKKEKFVLSRFV